MNPSQLVITVLLQSAQLFYYKVRHGLLQTAAWLAQLGERRSAKREVAVQTPGGGGHFRNFWVGLCRWDPGTLNLYQS